MSHLPLLSQGGDGAVQSPASGDLKARVLAAWFLELFEAVMIWKLGWSSCQGNLHCALQLFTCLENIPPVCQQHESEVLTHFLSWQDPDRLLTGEADGYVSGQIYYDVFKARGNSAAVSIIVMGIPAIAMFLTGMSSVTANAR